MSSVDKKIVLRVSQHINEWMKKIVLRVSQHVNERMNPIAKGSS